MTAAPSTLTADCRADPIQAAFAPRTSDEAVRGATGRDRSDWFGALDAWGAAGRSHREIAAFIRNEHGLDNWWAQTITVDYEQARGMRLPGGKPDGTFAVNASATIAVPVERLFEAFVDATVRNRWLPRTALRLRTSQHGRSARFDWEDGATRVIVGFVPVSGNRSRVSLHHERLPDTVSAARERAAWRDRLAALATAMGVR